MPTPNQNNKPLPNDNKSPLFSKSPLDASRGDVSKTFRGITDTTRSWGSHVMSQSEERRLEKKLFSSKYGKHISPEEFDRKIQELKKLEWVERKQFGNRYEASKFRDQIDYLRKAKQKLYGEN